MFFTFQVFENAVAKYFLISNQYIHKTSFIFCKYTFFSWKRKEIIEKI